MITIYGPDLTPAETKNLEMRGMRVERFDGRTVISLHTDNFLRLMQMIDYFAVNYNLVPHEQGQTSPMSQEQRKVLYRGEL